jgi:nucleoid-associated protein YgaU
MNALRRLISPVVVLAFFVAGGFGLSVLTAGTLAAVQVPRATFDDLVSAGASVIAWALFAYLALGALLTFLAAIPGAVGAACGTVADAVTPRTYRRIAQVALGLTVIAGPGLASTSATAAPNDASTSVSSASGILSLDRPGNTTLGPGRVDLDRPGNTTTAPRATDTDPLIRPARDLQSVSSYRVERGDCLWRIAERELGPGATSAEITAEWHRWYRANRDVIGDNPDLILVGQVLMAP